jgi:hypothetical protein
MAWGSQRSDFFLKCLKPKLGVHRNALARFSGGGLGTSAHTGMVQRPRPHRRPHWAKAVGSRSVSPGSCCPPEPFHPLPHPVLLLWTEGPSSKKVLVTHSSNTTGVQAG